MVEHLLQRADQAGSPAALQPVAQAVEPLIAQWHQAGMPALDIAALVTRLNRRLFARLWALLAEPTLAGACCLMVMGSEGRGEQILKTDQDNGLLLQDGLDATTIAGIAEVARRFSAALADMGYPPCPGAVMLTNPLWQQPVAGFRESLRQWLYGSDPEGPMHLAIFFDAAVVAGDAGLLDEARTHLEHIASGHDIYLARFAAAADQFQEAPHWWARLRGKLDDEPLDIKKLGTFPIVHGVRALALQAQLRQPGTAQRLAALVQQGRMAADLAHDTLAALQLLMGLRLTQQLRQRARWQAASNELRPAELSADEKKALRAALDAVGRFRLFLRQHFRLTAL
jgi:CBS domain-containing protein